MAISSKQSNVPTSCQCQCGGWPSEGHKCAWDHTRNPRCKRVPGTSGSRISGCTRDPGIPGFRYARAPGCHRQLGSRSTLRQAFRYHPIGERAAAGERYAGRKLAGCVSKCPPMPMPPALSGQNSAKQGHRDKPTCHSRRSCQRKNLETLLQKSPVVERVSGKLGPMVAARLGRPRAKGTS